MHFDELICSFVIFGAFVALNVSPEKMKQNTANKQKKAVLSIPKNEPNPLWIFFFYIN